MIGRLKGKIIEDGPNWILLDVSGVGYKIFVLPAIQEKIRDHEAILYTHLYIREDMMNLYGFLEKEQLEIFELLISISGIGPKAALGILSISEPKTIKGAIAHGRSDLLMGVSGIGRKTAERIVLELKNKIQVGELASLPRKLSEEEEEVVEALVNLGYKKSEASKVLVKISIDLSSEDKIKEALKQLGK